MNIAFFFNLSIKSPLNTSWDILCCNRDFKPKILGKKWNYEKLFPYGETFKLWNQTERERFVHSSEHISWQ